MKYFVTYGRSRGPGGMENDPLTLTVTSTAFTKNFHYSRASRREFDSREEAAAYGKTLAYASGLTFYDDTFPFLD